ncbi:MAG TPA: hypothetical protein VFO76_09960 [Candidatus Kapabacteria bacterium]|nr:hypothetical protein [Candidatus Kapabacteria bacterium]
MKTERQDVIIKNLERMLMLAKQGVFKSMNAITITSNRDPKNNTGISFIIWDQQEGWAKRLGERLLMSSDDTFDNVHMAGMPTFPPQKITMERDGENGPHKYEVQINPAPGQPFRTNDGYKTFTEGGDIVDYSQE